MKRLILMRHAKTEPWNDGIRDRDRKLTGRGHDDANTVARQLERLGWTPDRALVSSARRTRETWKHVSDRFPACAATLTDELYLAGSPAIESLIALAADVAGTVLVIGHNPGLHDLAASLVRQAGSDNHPATEQLADKFPTGAAALLAADEDSPFLPVYFRLQDFIQPKRLG